LRRSRAAQHVFAAKGCADALFSILHVCLWYNQPVCLAVFSVATHGVGKSSRCADSIMANSAYLCCTGKEHTYPSGQQPNYDPKCQTVAHCDYAVPLLWIAIYRIEDIRIDELEVEGQILREPAPVVHRRLVARRLEESTPRIETVFPQSGSLVEHAKLLRTAIAEIDSSYSYVTIEMEEIACLVSGFHGTFRRLLQFMGGADVPDVRELMVRVTELHTDREFLSLSRFAGEDLPKEDWENLAHLLGGELYRDLPWIPKAEPPGEDPELILALKARDRNRALQLLEAGANPNQLDGQRLDAPIDYAVEFCQSAVDPLLAAGAKVTDNSVAEAAKRRKAKVLRSLLDAGGNPDAKHVLGQTPALTCVCESEQDAVEKAELLLQYGADPNALNLSHRSPLHESLRRDRLDLGEVLVGVTDDVWKRDAIREVIRWGKEEYARFLEAHGVPRPKGKRKR